MKTGKRNICAILHSIIFSFTSITKLLDVKFLLLLFFTSLTIANSCAQVDWLFLQGDDDEDIGSGIVIDSKGYIYVAGTFEGLVDFDPSSGQQNEQSNSAFFLQKLDQNQNLIWVKTFPGSGEIHDMHINGNDNMYIAGSFTGSAFSLSSSNSSDGFVVKLDEDGNIIWSKSITGYGIQKIRGMAIDNNGDLYLTGQYRQEADLDPGVTVDLQPYSANFQGFNPFITKWNSDGQYIWGQSYQTADRSGIDVIVDSQYNIYDVGSKLQNNRYVHYITKMDSSRNILWNKSGNGNYSGSTQFSTYPSSLALDQSDNLFIGGMFKGEVDLGYGDTLLQFENNSPYHDVFIQCLQPNGTIIWTKTFGDTAIDDVFDLKVSPSGKLYSTGSFTGSVEFDIGDSSSLEVSQGRDLYLMNWNSSDGSFNWVETFGGQCDYSRASALTFSNQGDVYGTGTYNGTIQDESGNSIFGHGDYDCIVYKIGGTTNFNEITPEQIAIYPNPTTSSIKIEGVTSGNVDLYSGTGQFILSFSINEGANLDISALEQGIYLLKFTIDTYQVTKRIIKL